METALRIFEWTTSNPVFVVLVLFLVLKYDLRETKKGQEHIKELLDAKLKPINEKLDNHISDVKTAIQGLTQRIDRLYENPPEKKEP